MHQSGHLNNDMTEASNELGRVSNLRANAVGEPGSRRFCLLVESMSGLSSVLWLEKEQLFNLGIALKNIIATVDEGKANEAGERIVDDEPGGSEASADQAVEFQVSQLAVGYNEGNGLYIIAAHAEDESEDSTIAVASFLATQQQVDALADEAFEVCAAGRPRCPLCSGPMGPEPHVCPKHNGHRAWEA